MPDLLFGPVPHQEAIDFIKSKPVVAREVFDGLLPDLKARAFTITGLEGQANVMQAVRDRIAELPAGALWNDVKKDVAEKISPFLVDPDASPEHRDGQIAAANRRAELLLRTHGFQAYQAAQFGVMDRQKDVLPYWQYQTMEDDRVRPEHAALDQIVLPADSPFWSNHFPPWDWGCRCQAVPISELDRDDLAQADKKRPTDDKLVLEGPVAQRLVDGSLTRNGRTYDVRAPRQKSDTGFGWDPSTLQMPLEELKARYDEQTWSEFEAWARRTSLGDGQNTTVWNWLGGRGGPTIPPPPKPAPHPTVHPAPAPQPPPPAPTGQTLDQFIAAHTALPGQMTPVEATKVIAALKQNHGITVAQKVTRISVARTISPLWKNYAAAVTQDFLDLIPASVLNALPKFTIQVRSKLSANAMGEYDTRKHVLALSDRHLAGDDAKSRETIFHELAHWVHLEGLKSGVPPLVAYAHAIKAHFDQRTAGEVTAQLPNYGPGTHGKKDKFWDTYMGREYRGIIDGSEIPTKVVELLTNASKLSVYWNIDLHRETIKKALAILFP